MDGIAEEFIKVLSNPSIVYLDNAGKSALPKSVEDAGVQGLRSKSEPWLPAPGSQRDVEQLRDLFSQVIHAGSKDNIAICPSTAFSMTMAARNIVRTGRLAAGQTVLLLEVEMASAVYPWQDACKEVGASLKVVATPDWTAAGASWTASILAALDDTVAVLALPQVHWCDGSLIGLEEISAHIRTVPAVRRPMLVVDVTQSAGAMPIDVQQLRPDFLACSVHKWLLGPYGMSLCYVSSELMSSWQPLDQHERSRLGSDQSQWDEVNPFHLPAAGYPEAFMQGARRLDAGGRPSFVLVPMLLQSLRLVLRWTDATQAYMHNLTDPLAKGLQARFGEQLTIIPAAHRCGHILGVRLRGSEGNLSAIAAALKGLGVITAVRGGCLRIAPYLYSTVRDMHVFEALFTQLLRKEIAGHVPRTRVLIIGATAWLGQFLFHQLLDMPELEVFGTYSRDAPLWLLPDNRHALDLLSNESINECLAWARPQVVLHLAAMSSPMQCHKDPAAAYAVNCPLHLLHRLEADYPACRVVFTSTDMVFDGDCAPYAPSAPALPVNVYGSSKLAFEQALLASPLDTFVLRLSNMLGSPYLYRPVGEKFLEFLSKACASRQTMGLKDFERRSFVDVWQVAALLADLASGKHASSVLHVGGPVGLTRLQLAGLLGNAMGVELIVGQQGDAVGERQWLVTAIQADRTPAPEGSLRSPQDITMEVQSLERALGWTFSAVEECLPGHVALCQKVLRPYTVAAVVK